ncbi:MAG: ribokinase [Azospirillaceae bacterium]
MAGSRISVVGSFAVGMTIRSPELPVFGQTLLGSDFDMGPGGKGSNQAVAASRLGARTALVAILGDDPLARIAHDLYAAEGVDTTHLTTTTERPTGVGFIILNRDGDNFIILDMGANELMGEAHVEAATPAIAGSGIVMTVLEIPTEAARRAMQVGREHGALTILNPAPARELPPDIFRFVDYLTPNESEIRILLGLPADDPTPTPKLARRLRDLGVGNLVVTMGERGTLVLTDEGEETVPGCKVAVVDSTGAGDAFNAGFAVALGEGRPILDAVRFGCACGALACTRLGVIPALANRIQADKLYQETYGTF